MTNLRKQLETQLTNIEGIELSFYKDTDLLVMSYNGREIAHFHNEPLELDTRIPKKFAKRHALGQPHRSPKHPQRSINSIWRPLPYKSEADVDEIIALIKDLVAEEYSA